MKQHSRKRQADFS